VEDSEKLGEDLRKVSEGFVVGLIKAALPPYRIELRKLRLALRLAVAAGYDPVLLYQRALEGRPERWEKPPLADEVVKGGVEEQPPAESLEEIKEMADELRSSSPETPPSKKSTKS